MVNEIKNSDDIIYKKDNAKASKVITLSKIYYTKENNYVDEK